MKFELKKEWPSLLFILLPFTYLALIWNELPDIVPSHWNARGEIDGYSSKMLLLMVPFFLPILVYPILFFAPVIDPKKKVDVNSSKFQNLKHLMTMLMSLLAVYIIYSSHKQSLASPSMVFVLVGVIISVLGNYMQTVKPNYFIGIRTPWTLESEEVWRKTHQYASKFWFFGGAIMAVGALLVSPENGLYLVLGITVVIGLLPVLYSYRMFKKEEK